MKGVYSIFGNLGSDPNDSKVDLYIDLIDPNVDPNDPDITPNGPDVVPKGIIIPDLIQIPHLHMKYAFLGKKPMMYNMRFVTVMKLMNHFVPIHIRLSCLQLACRLNNESV